MDNSLTPEILRVCELAAIASARLMGKGNRKEADQAAVTAMRKALNDLPIKGRIVIGEGERDEAPMLYIGEEVGTGTGPEVDIAVDPLEGTNLCATGLPNALTVMAVTDRNGLLYCPDTYMEKLVVRPQAKGMVDIRKPVKENLEALAKALGRDIDDLVVVVLDRPRHENLIKEIRAAGARIKLISDGDITPAIAATVEGTGIHALMGIGGAPEGVLSAAAVKSLGGEMQARMRWRKEEEKERAIKYGMDISEDKVYTLDDLVPSDNIVFVATGVTKGDLLNGVRFFGGGARTHSLVIDSKQRLIRFVDTIHIFDRLVKITL
ncbi:MAG: class II fructose-bisphosphatase [Thermodesulfovibrio sp.]|uniref:class II fructose-bisphosphatase n=1 Tax=unclassified Thermodesulfovibrio TaxID=2645936 RepID=UPI00083B9BAE|nr:MULTISPECIES: class II fructose-bisphosphatase [unclassified Thermodesulfovibrio]MDI1471702.1 class II fructose-bisphosphatase [Thermodesulfovibrio sp. 1176]MDI6713593.1 class II fructose-bisphosphatase [Thermodesulfovibrio sp.]ODA44271.1 Fructose-1,6-bisphosphatase, GlpX type [Thermodesulfovibrio sp. N1]